MVGGGMSTPEKTDSKLSVCDNMNRDSNKPLMFHSHLLDGCMLDYYDISNVFNYCGNDNLETFNDISFHTGPGFEYDPQARVGKLNGNPETHSRTYHHTGPGFEYDPQAMIGSLNGNPETCNKIDHHTDPEFEDAPQARDDNLRVIQRHMIMSHWSWVGI